MERLHVYGFQLTRKVIHSIGNIKNLTVLELFPPDYYDMTEEKKNLSSIANLTNLKTLDITWNYGFGDQFFIDLCNNSKQLQYLRIICPKITDDGLDAVNKLSQLEWFSYDSDKLQSKDVHHVDMTDRSI